MAKQDYTLGGGAAQFTPLSELFEGIDYLTRKLLLGRANFPRIDSLKVGMAALCDDEFMQITEIGQGFVMVKRGTADTVPAKHGKGALIWFIDINVVGTDRKEYSAGESTGVKYSPYTIGGGKLDVNKSGQIDQVTYNYRQYRPYPPGQLRVRGDRWWMDHSMSADNPLLPLTWVHRDRRIQADQLLDHDDPGVGPEGGTTYTARIYSANGELRRTETGIMAVTHDWYNKIIAPKWSYTWQQAMLDLGLGEGLEFGSIIAGKMTFHSTRDGFDSWQGYEIPFKVNTQGFFIKVAQVGEQVGQVEDMEEAHGPYPPANGVYGAQIGMQAAQPAEKIDYEDVVAADGMYVSSLHEGIGQETSFYTNLNRNLFEAPYAHLAKIGSPRVANKVVTVVARPGDRLTDTHSVWSRYDFPRGRGDLLPYDLRTKPRFTPWITLGASLDYLDTVLQIGGSSFYDGVALDGVQPGQVAMIGAEMVRIESRTATTMTIARGVYDTVPAKHNASARVWFFQADAGDDPTAYPLTANIDGTVGAAVEVKMVPGVYGPPLKLKDVPTDRLEMLRRTERPYAPGEVLVNGQAWYRGAQIAVDQATHITWNHRNRDTQADQAIDHHAPTRVPEDGQKYRLFIKLTLRGADNKSYEVTVRNVVVDGDSFTYTYAMAQADGYRAGTLLNVCGRVTVGLVLEAIRGEFSSWQNYVIPLLLPSFKCPPGVGGGGGQLPPNNGGGNGNTGPEPGGPTTPPPGPGDDNEGGGGGPGDNDDGDDGTGPPKPPDVPPDWPDPVDPPPGPDPEDPNPALASHWDTNWDRHWDAYTKDNEGT